MENFLSRLNRNPYAPIDGASVTKFDELGNGLDDWGNVIAPRFEAPEQTWGETALGVATAPARLATALAGSLSPYGADGWQVPPVAQEGWNALTAVGDAYTQGMSEDEMRNRALGMAGFMMGGGGLAAKPTLKAAAAPAPRAAAAQSSLRLLLDESGDSLPSKAPWESPQRYAYEIQSGAGDDIGWLSMALDPTGKTAFVDHVAMSNRDAGGLKGSRDLFRTIKQQHPDLESIYGYRMRNGEATPDDKMQMFDLTRLHSNASKEGAVPALASALGQEQKGITAYHGSPHDFDKFDLSKIGTGEGAQAYGHGLYFAENEGVARSYRDNLGGGDLYIKGEKQPFVGAGYAQDTVNRQLMRNHGNVEETLNWLNGEIDTLQRRGVDEDTLGEFLAARDNLSGAAAENAVKFDQGGKMYQVRINADPNDFLDWDKPLSQQSEKVRQAMAQAAQAEAETKMARRRLEASKAEMMGMKWSQPDPIDPMSLTGADLWDRVPENSGIPGTRYLDQMSRDVGDGSYNYAVWDDSLIEILKKYGWLVPGAGYGANALSQGQKNQY